MSDELRTERETALAEAEGILAAAEAEKRGLSEDEQASYDAARERARGLRDLITRRANAAAERAEVLPELVAVRNADEGASEAAQTPAIESVKQRDPGHYTKRSLNSWVVDLADYQLRGDEAAKTRLAEQQAFNDTTDLKQRDLYLGSTTGQEFAPPQYLQDLFVEARVATAVTAGLCTTLPVPATGRSVTVPKQTGNAAVGIQTEATPLTALTETDAAFGDATATVYEIAGVQDISNYVVDRGAPGADMVIMRNLAKLTAAKVDYYVLHGSGSGQPQGIRGASSINAVTYTDASPTFAEAQAAVADMIQQIHTGWYESPDCLVMHPRRWAKWLSERDGDGRLQGGAAITAVNPMAVGQIAGTPQGGPAGYLHGLPVYLDANILTTSGSGTNEDTIFGFVRSQALLWTSDLKLEVDRSINFKTSGVAVRARQYAAFMVGHAPEAFGTVTGTGLAAPTYS